MFVCPTCHKPLTTIREQRGMFWRCPSCDGRMLTVASLRRQAQRDFVNALWQNARANEDRKKRPCPSCRRKMVETIAPVPAGGFYLDVCLHCQSIWFDATELEQTPQLPQPPEESPQEKKKGDDLHLAAAASWNDPPHVSDPPAELWKMIPLFLGLPTEGETEVRQRLPWATWLLASAVLIVSLLAFLDLERAVASFGMIPAEWWRLGGFTSLTSFFIHGGLFHLFSNLYFLLIFGDNVEDTLGRASFLVMLLIATYVGDVAHILIDHHSTVPAIGASGGISAIIAFYAFKFPKARICLGFFVSYRYDWISLPAMALFVIWIVIQLAGLFGQAQGIGDVSSAAHLGGVSVGAAFWALNRHK